MSELEQVVGLLTEIRDLLAAQAPEDTIPDPAPTGTTRTRVDGT